jgi:hypothetical protein
VKGDNSDQSSYCIEQIQPVLKTYFDVDPEIDNLKIKRENTLKSIKLASMSDVYVNRVESYKNKLLNLDNMLQQANDLKQKCMDLIKNILIGAELDKLNTFEDMENGESIEFKVQQITQEFNNFKDDAQAQHEAYIEVLKFSQGVFS